MSQENEPTTLSVRVDGTTVDSAQSREIWERFSQHMDANQGDFAGFAQKEGHAYASVDVIAGRPVLILGQEPPAAARNPTKGKKNRPSGGKKRRRGGRKRGKTSTKR